LFPRGKIWSAVPAFGVGEFGNRVVEPVGGHGKQRGLVWRGRPGLFGAPADGRADAEFLPEGAGGKYDTKFEYPLDRRSNALGEGIVGDA
jgi:hypothetical protein